MTEGKEQNYELEIEKELDKDNQLSRQRQLNKQINNNWFDQKAIVKLYQGQESENDIDSEAEAGAKVFPTSVSEADVKPDRH